MDSLPDQRPTSSATTVLIILVALPLMALVTAVVLSAVSLEDQPARQQAVIEQKDSGEAEDSTAGTANVAQAKVEKSAVSPMNLAPVATSSPPLGTAGQASSATPWQAALDLAGEPPSYTKIAFLAFEEAFDRPDRDDLSPWFERTAGAGFRISKIATQYGKSGTIEGIGRLRCPWPADGVLRLQLDNFNRLKMHFYHNLAGMTLVYYEDQGNRWAAYATTRDEGKVTPKTWAITATDDDRCRRTEMRFGGPIELRYRDGEVILSRGDVDLLTAPLGGPPSDVFFEGRATIHGIALARTKDAPVAQPLRPIAREVEHPAELTWTATHPEIAKPERSADGSLLFVGDKLKHRAECFALLPASGLNEVVLELADVSPGAGVYLGRTDGKPGEVVRFCRDRKSGELAVRLGNGNEEREADFDSPADKSVPLVRPHCWIRLLYGCGNLRWWLSSDGVHWAQTEPARDNCAPGITSIGLALAPDCPDARLTLKRIVLRRLEGLSSLADKDLVERAPAIVTAKALAEWLPEAVKHKPAEIETADWLRACTIRTLGAGAARELAYALLEALLDDAANRGLLVEQQLAALDDAMLMTLDLRDGQAMHGGILSRYAQLGERAADEQGFPAWSTVRDHYHAAPANTWMQMPTDLDRVIRWELVSDAYRREPHATLDFLSRLRFFQQHRERPMVEWVEWLASRDVSGRAGESVARLKDSWREPLVEELSKDTYNALTELKAVLESESWDDAARLVTSLDPVAAAGVAPYVNDRTLLTSLPVAVQLTLEDYPHVRQALGDKFAALARLRISQAINVGDAAAIELATGQFAGTPAAAEAHRWLGDRALVAGHFARAITEYERAGGTSAALDEVIPRIRLAAAMQGRDAGSPVTQSVQFGDVSMSPAKFETLIAEMRSRGSSSVPAGASGPAESVPKPTAFESYVRSRLDGPVGDRPQEEVGRRTNQHRVPWADRQIATVVESDVMYVANRFQVAAYNLASGERIWQSQTPPGQIQRAQEWPMIPMRPLVVGNRIFVRLLYSPSPLLVCLEKSSGKLLWVSENREREFLVSDPLLVQGQLVALSIAIEPDQQGLLRYCTLDPQTGEMLRQRELVRLRSTWGARAYCEVVEHEDGLTAALGGVLLGLDTVGNVRWVRSQIVLPADEDPRWVLQMYQRPLVKSGRLYVAQPGVRTVECLAAATGRRYWSAVLPEVVGIVGLAGELLVVRAEGGVRGLILADGTTRWKYDADDLFSFQLMDDDRLLIARRERAPDHADQWQTRLTWLNPADGKPIATTMLSSLADSDPRLGPLVPYKNRLFTFFGRGQHDPTRDVVELIAGGEAESVLPRGDAWHERLSAASKP